GVKVHLAAGFTDLRRGLDGLAVMVEQLLEHDPFSGHMYKPNAVDPRLADLLSRKPVRVVMVALANKTARVIWVIMTRGGTYRAPVSAATALFAASAASRA